jgi:hypothetical protein
MSVLLGLWRRLWAVSGQLVTPAVVGSDATGWDGKQVSCLKGRIGVVVGMGRHGALARLLVGGRQCGVASVSSAAAGPAAG